MRLVYIGGVGRSGSTVLELALASCPDVFAVGEAVRLAEWRDRGHACSCGRSLETCPVWRVVLDAPEVGDARTAEELRALAAAVGRITGATTLVDASKTGSATRDRVSSWRGAADHLVIAHVIRPPHHVYRSVRSGSNRWLEGTSTEDFRPSFVRVLVGWLFWNAWALGEGVMVADRFVTVRNARLRADPDAVVALVTGQEAPTSPGEPVDHGIAGNRLRRGGGARPPRPVRQSVIGRAATAAFGWPAYGLVVGASWLVGRWRR